MFSYLFRLFVIFIPANLVELYLMARFFYRKKALWPLVSLWFIRILFVMPLYLPREMMTASFLRICVLAELFLTPIQNVVFVWTFYNERSTVSKVLALGLICDSIASIAISVSTYTANFIAGYPLTVTSFAYPFQITDLIAPMISVAIFGLLFTKGKSILRVINEYEFKHPLIASFVLIPVYLVGYLTSVDPLQLNGLLFYSINSTMIALIMLVISAYMYTINNQRHALRASSQMVNDHYQLLQSRIDDLEHQQSEINAKMAVLVAQNFPEDLTQRYLNDMKTIKDNLYQTLYTHYYMIDAVLSAKARDYQKKGIDFKCQCAGLELKHLSQIQVAQVLMTLFRYIDQYDQHSIDLKISSHHNQVIIVLEPSENTGMTGLKRQLSHQMSNKMMSIQKKKHTIYLSLTD